MNGLLKGELYLTADIILGLILAEAVIKLKIADLIMRRFMPENIPAVTGLAAAVSAGSSKAGAAILSSALENHELNERSALWSVLMLPLPSYLRRWPSTLALSVSMAGNAGMIFALSLLARSIMRFFIALHFLRKENPSCPPKTQIINSELSFTKLKPRFASGLPKKLIKTLPLAWLLFALAYSVVPLAEGILREIFSGNDSLMPLSGWAVSAAGMGHVSSALALAGGAMSSGELSTSQAVFALILGSGLGTVSRVLRQNAGYYYGLFPKALASKMLFMNLATIIPLIMMNLLFAGLALLL